MRSLPLALLFLFNGVLLYGQDLFKNNEDDFGAKTKVSLLVEASSVKPGTTVNVGLLLKMPDGWHTYWKNPGETGDATKIKWALPVGIEAGEMQWPVPEKMEAFDQITYAYHHEVLLIIPLQLAKDIKPGEYELKGAVTWLECEETCLPGEKEVTAKLLVGDEQKMGGAAGLFSKWRKHLPDNKVMTKMTAKWEGMVDDKGMRSVHMEVPLEGRKIEFLPFGTEGLKWSIGHKSTNESGEGLTLIKKFIKSETGNWPESIPGVVRVEKDGKIKGYKTAFVFDDIKKESKAPVKGVESKSIWLILGGAFLGGVILNIMPCVLPVISLKILGFVQQSQETPERVRKLGLTYGLGVLFSFLVLAGMMIAVKKSTGMASWGMQMQNPYFNLALLLVVTLVALNLFGTFEVNLGGETMGKANAMANREGYMGAFFNGLLATALATPCTAPFLAPAMGIALTQGSGVIIASMSAVAAGLAFPFILLTFQPGWLGILPKPGNWMVQFKQIMGFPMLAAAIWVLSFTGPMFGKSGVMWLGVLLCVVALATWVFGEFMQRTVSKSSAPLVICVLILAAGYATALEWGLDWRHPENRNMANGDIEVKAGGVQWKKWSPTAVAAARSEGHPVLIDFTADWCVTCKYTKSRALEVKPVIQKLKEIGAVAFLADWTNKDPVMTEALHRYKRGAVPLVLVYPPQGEAIVLPPVMSSPEKVLEALDKAVTH
tara:strand:- start:487 stop:2634 length:2148 start_codon:yes stop_codon:yes gene_type:complete